MLGRKLGGGRHELDVDQLVSLLLETGDDRSDQTSLDAVGLDGNLMNDER